MATLSTKFNSGVSSSIGSPGGTVVSEDMDKIKWQKQIKIATWNVKTMSQAGKINNAIKEMQRMKLDILGISEMRWPGTGIKNEDDYTVYYSGTTDNTYKYGVGFIIEKEMAKCVKNFIPLTERIALLQLNSKPVNINLIQIYAPTTDHGDEEVEQLYSQVSKIIQTLPKHEIMMIMGDFNAKLGKGRMGEHIGDWGLGERNDRGDMLSTFAAEHNLIVSNTFFQHRTSRLYTWKSPDRRTRNQIDFVLINQRFRNSITDMRTYPGADIRSDHNPLIGNIRIRLKKVAKKQVKRYDYRKLKDTNTKNIVKRKLETILQGQENETAVDDDLKSLQNVIKKVQEEHLKPDKNMRKSWMTEEILELMEIRRIHKNNPTLYKAIQKQVRIKIRSAKEAEKLEKCIEIEICQAKFDSFNLHKKVKEMAGITKRKTINVLTDEQGIVVLDKENIKKTWEQYIKELFHDVRTDPPTIDKHDGPQILKSEIEVALKNAKDRKALGPDEIPVEILKLLEGENMEWLARLFNKIYDSGIIPQEWIKSEFVILPKKPNARKCSDFRTISLMSHLLKIFLKVIHGRIFKLCEEQVSESQFGFRRAVGTREALFSIQVLFQRCRDVNCDIYACFVDYQKAFDRVQHSKMIKALQETGLDGKDLKIIANLYWNQVSSVKLEGENTNNVQILRGVRQGCVLSPVIFNVYSEHILKEALQDMEAGILLNGERINNIRYADDTVIFADSFESLQNLMDRVTLYSRKYGLDVNISKTKCMVISKKQDIYGTIFIDGTPLERVKQYTYLGTNVNDDWDHSREIRIRIEKARAAFIKMKKVFTSHDLQLSTKLRLLRCYVFSILFYGVESWTLTEASSKKLDAFEMWLYRRILRIPWTAKVTNKDVLRRMKKEMEVLNTVKVRKLQYLGHIMRNENRYFLLQNSIQGKVYGPG
uniref:Craniofacial development protein 2 n=1 Tax=Cacopsylla melanoneura TaxID=428564 RepID=A0A8D8SMX4_9HEMI